MHLSTFIAFVILDTALCFVPGVAVMTVVGAALTRRSAGLATACGILTGNALYFIVSAFGLVSLLLASQTAFTVLKWCGAAYLAYLGVHAIFSRGAQETAPSAPGLGLSARHTRFRAWATGTMTQLANPKALVFFAAIVPQFVDPSADVAVQVVILGIASTLIELAVLSTYVFTVDAIRARGIAPAQRVLAERVGGACLLGVAAAVIVQHA